MPKRLTEAQQAAYQRDGFVAPIDIFTADEVAQIHAELEAAEAAHAERLAVEVVRWVHGEQAAEAARAAVAALPQLRSAMRPSTAARRRGRRRGRSPR